MRDATDTLLEQALTLQLHDRVKLASDLLASLDGEPVDAAEIDRLWSIETQRRAGMLKSGEAGTVSWDEIRQRFSERRAQRTV